jgi:hypothetical protein
VYLLLTNLDNRWVKWGIKDDRTLALIAKANSGSYPYGLTPVGLGLIPPLPGEKVFYLREAPNRLIKGSSQPSKEMVFQKMSLDGI